MVESIIWTLSCPSPLSLRAPSSTSQTHDSVQRRNCWRSCPVAEVVVQVAPRRACPRDPEYTIQHQAMIPRPADTPRPRLDHERREAPHSSPHSKPRTKAAPPKEQP